MFDDVTFEGRALDRAYAQRRMRWEPVYEVTQMKGDGETHPRLSPRDQFADFYTWDKGSFGPDPKTPDMLPREYAREAYKRGLAYDARLGSNPFKFGMIGSTDSHTGLSTAEEDNYYGKIVALEPTADPIRFSEPLVGRFSKNDSDKTFAWQTAAAGLAAVWARENTREAIWDALARKEVYATTGTRMLVRVFGGWDFVASDLDRSNFAKYGYDKGVPMGGDLPCPCRRQARILIRALRDPEGANVDRVQVIKGCGSADGRIGRRVQRLAGNGRSQADSGTDVPRASRDSPGPERRNVLPASGRVGSLRRSGQQSLTDLGQTPARCGTAIIRPRSPAAAARRLRVDVVAPADREGVDGADRGLPS